MSTAAVPNPRSAASESHVLADLASFRRPSQSFVVLMAVVAVSGLYVLRHLGRGWMPFDDGALAQSAERWLQGELPHRDFDDIYTGGLALLNAAGFKVFGTTLWSMRVVLFGVFLAWLPAVYFIARRFVRPLAAAGVTLLAVVWSLPNYTAAMPSWYNLFLATFGTAALFRYLEERRARWLVLAGIAGGLSFLVKVVGLYFVAAMLLYLVFQENEDARSAPQLAERRATGYALFVSTALLLFVAALAALVRRQLHGGEVVHFFVPAALIAALIAQSVWSRPAGPSLARFRRLAALVVPLLAGVALPVAAFLVPYAISGALGAFVHGVFVLPTKRFGFASGLMLPLSTLATLIPLAALALIAVRSGERVSRPAVAALALGLAAVLHVTGLNSTLYKFVWDSVRNLAPALVVVGVAVLARDRAADVDSPLLRSQTFLLLAATALCSLVQFPYAVPNYFCYVAPLVVLTAVALLARLRPLAPAVPAVVMGFYLLFGALRSNTTTLMTMGYFYEPYRPTVPLRVDRAGGLRVLPEYAEEYDSLVPVIRSHASGPYIWASPDCPEVYFLSGLRNPTRTLFEFFDTPDGRDVRILKALDSRHVTLVVLNRAPAFSPWLSRELLQELYHRYPHSANVGKFHVRWHS